MTSDKPQKSLNRKLAAIHADPSGSKEFIIADAKDADMAFGITAPGQKRPLNPERVLKSEIRWKTLEEYRQQIRDGLLNAVAVQEVHRILPGSANPELDRARNRIEEVSFQLGAGDHDVRFQQRLRDGNLPDQFSSGHLYLYLLHLIEIDRKRP